jgi:hypothetical protein
MREEFEGLLEESQGQSLVIHLKELPQEPFS